MPSFSHPCLSLALWQPAPFSSGEDILTLRCASNIASLVPKELFRSDKKSKNISITVPGYLKRKENKSDGSSLMVLVTRHWFWLLN